MENTANLAPNFLAPLLRVGEEGPALREGANFFAPGPMNRSELCEGHAEGKGRLRWGVLSPVDLSTCKLVNPAIPSRRIG